ncbi:hypothetical protein S245_032986, partial [Arachis hypogaea]
CKKRWIDSAKFKRVSCQIVDISKTLSLFIELQTLGGNFCDLVLLIDSLDTLALLGDCDRFAASVEWIGKNIRFDIDEEHENKGKDESCEAAESGASERKDATDEIM